MVMLAGWWSRFIGWAFTTLAVWAQLSHELHEGAHSGDAMTPVATPSPDDLGENEAQKAIAVKAATEQTPPSGSMPVGNRFVSTWQESQAYYDPNWSGAQHSVSLMLVHGAGARRLLPQPLAPDGFTVA